MSNPAKQRVEIVLGGPGEIAVHHVLDPLFVNSSFGTDLRVREEPWAKV
jgi:hypothetical protein